MDATERTAIGGPLSPHAGPVVRYGFGVLLVLAALGATLLLRPYVQTTWILFFAAVVATALLVGRGPALAATLLAVPLADIYVLPPSGRLGLRDATDILALVVFGAAAVAVSWLANREHAAREALEARTEELARQRAELQHRNRRARILAETSRLLATALDDEEALRELARFLCTELADYVVTYALEEDDEEIRRVGLAHADPDQEPLLRRLLEIGQPAPEDSHGAGAVIRTGEPILAEKITDELLRRATQGPEHLEIIRKLGPISSMVLPFRARGRTLGAIAFATTARSGRHYGEEDLDLARELADRAAVALDNLRLYGLSRREVTERRRAEVALMRREREFRHLAEHAPDIIARFDRDLRHQYVNPAIEEVTGIGRDEFIGRTNEELGLADAVAAGREAVEEVFRTGRPRTVEFPFATPAGTRWFSARIVPELDDEGTVETVLSITREVTARRLAEQRRELLLQAGLLFTSSLDQEAILESVARLCARTIADYCIADIVDEKGMPERSAMAAEDPGVEQRVRAMRARYPPRTEHPEHPIREVIRTGEPVVAPALEEGLLTRLARDEEHVRRTRELRIGSYIVVPLVTRGRPLGTLTLVAQRGGRVYGPEDAALARELALSAGLALENARLYERAEKAVRLREEMLAMVAHDLRNPLGVISMAGRLLATSPGPDREDFLDMLDRAVERAAGLINDLLDVSRMEAGKFSVSPEIVELEGVVAEACETVRPAAAEKGVALEYAIGEGCERVRAERPRILRVLLNLLENAVEFSPESGHARVRAAREEEEVVVSVSDEGPGMAPDLLPHVFESFWRGEARADGVGLGLAIVKGIVEAHGGRVWAESQEGEGSTFSFTLPAAAPDA